VPTAGSAVVTAGVTVVIALAGLAVVGIPFLTQMGIAAAATIVIAVAVAVTLVPATLGFLGRRALPKRDRGITATGPAVAAAAVPKDGFLTRWVALVTRRRVLAVLLTGVTLGVITLPVLSMQTTLVPQAAAGTTQDRADHLLTGAFGNGFTGPLTVLFEGAGAAGVATGVIPTVSALADVAAVSPPIPNAAGTAALLTVIPKSGPSTPETQALVTTLRDALSGTSGVEVSVTGATAVSVDVTTAVNDALPVYLVLVVGLAFILLVLVFRSLLVPLVGVLGFLLTLGAALGSTVAVFQWGWLADLLQVPDTGPLIALAPILVIGILFGLAMDYQVFLVSRMHEAHAHGAAPVSAVRNGFRQAAPVVVAAALIMFGVFAGFASGDDATLKSIAFALAVGIVVDAFVVRMILVPAALALLGEKAWWLPRSLHWLPVLDVEGAALQRVEPADDVLPEPADAVR
jgi:RND superfamily putative drug exporter